MFEIVRGTARLVAARWPALLAIFLAGWIVNFEVIRFAGFMAKFDPLYGYLILPVAILARVISYVAMFLVLRPAMRGFSQLEGEIDAGVADARRGRMADVLASSILPFFVVFATWGMLQDDWVAYLSSMLDNRSFDDTDAPLEIEVSVITVGIVVVAFVLRLLLKRFADRLPRWFSFLAAYLEAVWIFIAVIIIGELLAGLPAWLESRRIVAFFVDVINGAKEAFAPFAWLWDSIAWLVDQAGTVVVLPLAWLTLAGIVYGKALATAPTMGSVDAPPLAAARAGWARLPGFLRKRLAELAGDFTDRWQPIANSGRLIINAGILAMAFFVLAYAVLDTSTLWLDFGLSRLIGPHEGSFWTASTVPYSLLLDAVVEPLRIALIAAAYDFSLRQLRRDSPALERELATA